jgi:hypothetical protein
MGVRMAWIDCDRTSVSIDCVVELAVRLEDYAKVAVPVRLVGHKRKASLDKLDGFADLPLLVRQHTRVVQCARMIITLSTVQRYSSAMDYWPASLRSW